MGLKQKIRRRDKNAPEEREEVSVEKDGVPKMASSFESLSDKPKNSENLKQDQALVPENTVSGEEGVAGAVSRGVGAVTAYVAEKSDEAKQAAKSTAQSTVTYASEKAGQGKEMAVEYAGKLAAEAKAKTAAAAEGVSERAREAKGTAAEYAGKVAVEAKGKTVAAAEGVAEYFAGKAEAVKEAGKTAVEKITGSKEEREEEEEEEGGGGILAAIVETIMEIAGTVKDIIMGMGLHGRRGVGCGHENEVISNEDR